MYETMLCVAVGVLIGSIIGGVLDMVLCPDHPTKIRDTVHVIIFWICCVLFVVSVVSVPILGTAVNLSNVEERESKEYNNGICTSCGGHMVFFESSKAYRKTTEYFYQCDKCKKTIRTTSFY